MIRTKSWHVIFSILLIVPILSGCWNAREIDKMFFAHAVGIDYQDGEFIVYTQLTNFAGLSKVGGEGIQSGVIQLGRGKGKTVDTAFHDMYRSSQRRIFWGHLSAIVFTESGLKHALKDAVELFVRYRETRYTIWMFATADPIEQLLSIFPIHEPTNAFSRLGDPTDIYDQSSFIRPLRLNRFISYLYEPAMTTLLPKISVDETRWTEDKKKQPQLAIDGMALLKGDQFKGWLTGNDLLGIRWMTKQTRRTPLIVYEKDQTQPAAVIISQKPKVKIIPSNEHGKPRFSIRVKLTGSLIQLNQRTTEKELTRIAETAVENEIRRSYQEGLKRKADVLNLMLSLYRSEPNKWKQLTADQRFSLKRDSLQNIEVTFKITSEGKNELTPFSP